MIWRPGSLKSCTLRQMGAQSDVWTGSGRTGSHLYPTMTLRAGEIPSTCLTVLLDPVKLYFRTPRTTTTM